MMPSSRAPLCCRVATHRSFDGGYRVLEIEAQGVAKDARPGQFVQLIMPVPGDGAVSRPFSIFDVGASSIFLVIKEVGQHTRTLAGLRAGDSVELYGPLGRPFPLNVKGRLPLLVGGGYGFTALHLLAKTLAA